MKNLLRTSVTVPLSQSLSLGQRDAHATLRDSLRDTRGTARDYYVSSVALTAGQAAGRRRDTHRGRVSHRFTEVGTEWDSGEMKP